MREHAVVLTYPGHFYLTQITIRSVQEHIQPNDITVIVDDWSFLAWDGYVEDCKQTYINCNIIHTSQFSFLKPFEGNPWIRQQVIKLLLHRMIAFDKWFFTDGDIEFFHDIPEDITPWSVVSIPVDLWENWESAPLADKGTQLTANYVNSMLGITNFWELPVTFKREGSNRVVSTSAVPFRDMRKETLVNLEMFIVDRFKQSLEEVHIAVMKDLTKAMSEWELIEAYRKYICNENLDMARISPQSSEQIPNILANNPDNTMFYLMHFLHDSELSPTWFQTRGIEIKEEIWRKIPQRRY